MYPMWTRTREINLGMRIFPVVYVDYWSTRHPAFAYQGEFLVILVD